MDFVKFKENLLETLKLQGALQVFELRESFNSTLYADTINNVQAPDITKSKFARANAIVESFDSEESETHELMTHGDNTHHLHKQKGAFIKNMQNKMKNGTYDHAKAPQLWKHYTDRVSQDYKKTHGSTRGSTHAFSPAVRMRAAKSYADHYHNELTHGNITHENF